MDTRQRLMQAASELMLETGFDGMTTAAVARRAGVSEGAIYRHFPSKEALAEAVFADTWRIFNEFMERELPAREQPKERLDAFFKVTLMGFDALMPTYGALCQQEHLHYTSRHGSVHGNAPRDADRRTRPAHAAMLPPGASDYVALLEEAIRLAQDAGAVRREVNPRVAAHFLFFGAGQAMEFFGDPHHSERGAERLPRDVAQQLEDLMIHSLYGDRE